MWFLCLDVVRISCPNFARAIQWCFLIQAVFCHIFIEDKHMPKILYDNFAEIGQTLCDKRSILSVFCTCSSVKCAFRAISVHIYIEESLIK